MPYTLVHQGVIRDFDFDAPPGWQHWVGKAWERGRIRLPLVVALHGGAQDPLGFQEDWFFPRVWTLSLDGSGNPGDPVAPGGYVDWLLRRRTCGRGCGKKKRRTGVSSGRLRHGRHQRLSR